MSWVGRGSRVRAVRGRSDFAGPVGLEDEGGSMIVQIPDEEYAVGAGRYLGPKKRG